MNIGKIKTAIGLMWNHHKSSWAKMRKYDDETNHWAYLSHRCLACKRSKIKHMNGPGVRAAKVKTCERCHHEYTRSNKNIDREKGGGERFCSLRCYRLDAKKIGRDGDVKIVALHVTHRFGSRMIAPMFGVSHLTIIKILKDAGVHNPTAARAAANVRKLHRQQMINKFGMQLTIQKLNKIK